MQVLQHHQQRLALPSPGQQSGHRVVAAQRRCTGFGRGRGGVCVQQRPDLDRGVARHQSARHQRAQDREPRPVRRGDVGLVAAPHRDRDAMGGGVVGRGHHEARLADARVAGDDHGPAPPGPEPVDGLGHRREAPRAADQLVRRLHRGRWSRGGPNGESHGWARGELRGLVQHGRLERPQLGGRIDAQLVSEPFAQRTKGGERIGLAQGLELADRQARPQPFPERVVLDQGPDLGGHDVGVAELEQRVGPCFDHRDPQLQQPGHLGLDEVGVGAVGVRRSVPDLESGGARRDAVGCGRRHGVPGPRLETPHVDRLRVGPERVAGGAGDEVHGGSASGPPWLEHAAQLGDHDLERCVGRCGRLAPPELIDEPLGRHRPSVARHQHGQDVTFTALGQRMISPVHGDGQRPEQPIRQC